MAAQKKAKAPEPAGESAPMWIVSFADLVTLMMSFFVVLYALKQGGPEQQQILAAELHNISDPGYMPPADANDAYSQRIRQIHGLPGPPNDNNGGKAPQPTSGATGQDATVKTLRPAKQIVTGTLIDFDVNSAVIDAAGADAIKQIAAKIRGLNNILYVKGHISADELTLRPDDPDGMQLSYQRATQVIDEFVKLGIDRRVLRPMACGAYEPVKTSAYSQEEMRLNRRVEVFTTENTVGEYVPINTVQATEKPAAENSPASAPSAAPSTAPAALTTADDKKIQEHP